MTPPHLTPLTPPDPIERLLAGTYPDPDGGPPLRVATLKVVIAPALAGAEAACLDGLSLGRNLAVVSDQLLQAIRKSGKFIFSANDLKYSKPQIHVDINRR